MRRIQSTRYFHSNLQKLLRMHSPARNPVLQRLPLEIFHHEENMPRVLADIMNGANIRMIQSRSSPSLAPEPVQGKRVPRHFIRKELQRHGPAQPHILSLINHTHPAAAQLLKDAVMRDSPANHGRGISHRRSILRRGTIAINQAASSLRSGALQGGILRPPLRHVHKSRADHTRPQKARVFFPFKWPGNQILRRRRLSLRRSAARCARGERSERTSNPNPPNNEVNLPPDVSRGVVLLAAQTHSYLNATIGSTRIARRAGI